MAQSSIRIGSRGSPLALAQANMVRTQLAAAHGFPLDTIKIHVIRTTGDAIQDRPLSEVGGKGLFTKEIEQALLDNDIDLAVHSSKDMLTVLPAGLMLAACLPREDPRDVFIGRSARMIAELPQGAVVGTASLRRQAQLKMLRPDLNVVPLRGNVETRLKKIAEGAAEATILAFAGLKRLGLAHVATAVLDPAQFLPAVGQGAIGIETRVDDGKTRRLVAAINDAPTLTAVTAERAFLAVLDGSCKTPIAGHAQVTGSGLAFRGLIARPDGSRAFEAIRQGDAADAAALGAEAGAELKARGGADFFDLH
ncbi:MAG TPA: hydroxymethylbilane synthase [Xanthobacteraceae bacterium]|nr:hydroxymethylbilane synthase [Xanthobacteraceae bacterium]